MLQLAKHLQFKKCSGVLYFRLNVNSSLMSHFNFEMVVAWCRIQKVIDVNKL